MKCPECDGTGKVVHPMMSMNGDEYTGEWEQYECEMCGGAGVIQGQAPGLVSCCPACDGKGFIEQTNEEWLRTATTEQLAEHLLNVWMDGAFNVNAEFGLNEAQIEQHKGYIVEWLKQPHKPFS